VTSQLARMLAQDEDVDVGVLDVDLCGPSIPKMLGVDGRRMHVSQSGLAPVYTGCTGRLETLDEGFENIAVVSIGFLLEDAKDAVIWRGNKRMGMLKQFLRDVQWDRCDYLLIDTPPGTTDEHLSLVQLCQPITGAILVTTPQEVSWQDVRKEIDFCRKVKVPILGLVINMAEFVCPACTKPSEIFPSEAASIETWAAENGVRVLAKIPLDPRIGRALDSGQSFADACPESPANRAYLNLAEEVRKCCE
jgi:Mrp family chromosome partitioning ATPase